MKTWLSFFAALAIAGFGLDRAQAGTVTAGDTIIGIFSSPVLSGYLLNDPAVGQTTFMDNTGTAVSSIANSADPTLVAGPPPIQATGSVLQWGTDNPGGAPSAQGVSQLTFSGAPIPNTPLSQTFLAGVIKFLNGTSTLDSLIFGATLSFYDNSVSQANFLGSDQVVINSTQNFGVSVAQDSDYINICGNNSNICDLNNPMSQTKSINAIEDSEGGTGVTVELFATIAGDPQLILQEITLAPGQSTETNGFIGTDPPLALVPEPASWTVLVIGLGFIITLRAGRMATFGRDLARVIPLLLPAPERRRRSTQTRPNNSGRTARSGCCRHPPFRSSEAAPGATPARCQRQPRRSGRY